MVVFCVVFLVVLLVWALVGVGCIWAFFEMLKEKTPQPHTGFAGYRTILCSPRSHPPSFYIIAHSFLQSNKYDTYDVL